MYRLRNNWQASGLLQFESDDQQGLNLRTMVGGAIGNRVYNRRRMRIDLFSGLVLNPEEFDVTPRSESLEGLLGGAYRLRAARGSASTPRWLYYPVSSKAIECESSSTARSVST